MQTVAKPQSFSKPAYKKVEDDLRARIRNGYWSRGAMLPGRKALAVEYGVNLETVQRGIKQLVGEGILIADSRRGTFVASEGDVALTETAEPIRMPAPVATARKQPIIGLAGYVHITDFDWIASPVNSRGMDALELAAVGSGYVCRSINLCRLGDEGDPIDFNEAARQLAHSGVDGIVLMMGVWVTPIDMSSIMRLDIPIVLVSLQQERWPLPTVCYDHRDAGQMAGRHLIEQGCSNLLFFSVNPAQWAQDRCTGVRESMIMEGIEPEKLREYIIDSPPNLERAEFHELAVQAATDCLNRGIPFDGVIAANDEMAIGFMDAAKLKGLETGKDYAIVGFDDTQRSRFLGLSSLKPPIDEMGTEAISLLGAALSGKQTSRRVTLHSKLIVRESSLFNR